MEEMTAPKYSYQWFIDQYAKAKEKAIDFGEPISHDLFVLKPNENTWSVAECYSHLNSFGDQYVNQIKKRIDKAPHEKQPREADSTYPPRLVFKGLISFFAPPYKIKMKTVDPFSPASHASLKKEQVLQDYIDLQNTMVDLLKDAQLAGIDLGGTKVQNPVISFVKMRLSECFALAEVHQRRHMWQAEQVLNKVS